jgi:transcriptional regulator with XRE-family HTH domain
MGLRAERERRGLSRREFADGVGCSETWLREIEEEGHVPGAELRARVRVYLAECPIHRRFNVPCVDALPVPADEELYPALRAKLAEHRPAS